jgi:DNA-binding NarL/FixJ family response regulator
MLRIAIVDDSKEVQTALAGLLSTVAGAAVVGYAQDVEGAKSLIARTHPDVVILDVELRDGQTSMDVLRFIDERRVKPRTIMLSNSTWGSLRAGFLAAGAAAYFDKSTQFLEARDWIAEQHPALPGSGFGDDVQDS